MKRAPFTGAVLVTLALLAALLGPRYHAAARAAPAAHHLYHVDVGVKVFYKSITVFKFNPDHLRIHPGDSVQFTNVITNEPQTVTFGPPLLTPPLIAATSAISEINPVIVNPQGGHSVANPDQNVYSSGALMGGMRGLSTTYTFTFPNQGLYLYRSLFHPSMLGTLLVVTPDQAASTDAVDHGPTLFDVVRSFGSVLDAEQAIERTGAATYVGAANVLVGTGDSALTLNKFSPAGLTIKVGTSVRWYTTEDSGDPHALVFGAPTDAEQSGLVPLYTGRSADGGLIINADYATPSLPSASTVTTGTMAQSNNLYTSGIIYGANVNYPSNAPSSYTLTFDAPGQYYYVDPFHPGMLGLVTVEP
jgi:plastocyanin